MRGYAKDNYSELYRLSSGLACVLPIVLRGPGAKELADGDLFNTVRRGTKLVLLRRTPFLLSTGLVS